MAIVEMRRVSVLLMRRDQEAFLRLAQRLGCVHFLPAGQEAGPAAASGAAEQEKLGRLQWALTRLSKYEGKKRSPLSPLPAVSADALDGFHLEEAMATVEQAERLERLSGDLRGRQTRLRLMIDQLTPWLPLDLTANQLASARSAKAFTGSIKLAALSELEARWQGRPVSVQRLTQERDLEYILAFAHRSVEEEFAADLRAAGFQPASPAEGEGTPRQKREALQKELDELADEQAAIDGQMARLGGELPGLRLCYEALSADRTRSEAASLAAVTASASLLEGWIPLSLTEKFEKRVKEKFPMAQLEFRAPAEGEEPPVLLGNKPVFAPYESVVTGFALPDPAGIDPTAVMMPFFACFFGMMVSDAGYGIMMAVIIPILIRLMQPAENLKKLMLVLLGGGIATVFWGALYNTWFGFAALPQLGVFDAVNNSMPVMAVCIGLGALHLFAGLLMGAYMNFRDGKPLDALYDQFSWMMLVIGLGLLALPQTAAAGKWLAIAGAGIILLTAGRAKSRNPFKRLISGLGALYGVTSWISDLLSYMRLFGMGLATGVIGMVINQLVGMLTGSGIIGLVIGAVVFVGAHLFNAAINILGAYVHACRLQYIEFFGKFYQEGGKPFRPLRFSPRHVRVTDAS